MTKAAKHGLAAIPRGIWVLGLVSMCMDVSSELIHSLLPLYLALELGASTLTIGLLEGFAEATALIVKVFSGFLSDFFRRRKALVVLGYGLSALTKPIFPLSHSLGWIVGARLSDRVGKGIRGAPRDALIADITPEAVRGASFGLRQTLDTVGADRRSAAGDRCHAVFRRQLPLRVLDRRDSCGARRAAARRRRRRARSRRRAARCQRLEGIAFRRCEEAWPQVCDHRCHRRGVHAGALLRGFPGAACTECRNSGRFGAVGHGDHVDGLCRRVVPGGCGRRSRSGPVAPVGRIGVR